LAGPARGVAELLVASRTAPRVEPKRPCGAGPYMGIPADHYRRRPEQDYQRHRTPRLRVACPQLGKFPCQ
jgi:hypothetical protein